MQFSQFLRTISWIVCISICACGGGGGGGGGSAPSSGTSQVDTGAGINPVTETTSNAVSESIDVFYAGFKETTSQFAVTEITNSDLAFSDQSKKDFQIPKNCDLIFKLKNLAYPDSTVSLNSTPNTGGYNSNIEINKAGSGTPLHPNILIQSHRINGVDQFNSTFTHDILIRFNPSTIPLLEDEEITITFKDSFKKHLMGRSLASPNKQFTFKVKESNAIEQIENRTLTAGEIADDDAIEFEADVGDIPDDTEFTASIDGDIKVKELKNNLSLKSKDGKISFHVIAGQRSGTNKVVLISKDLKYYAFTNIIVQAPTTVTNTTTQQQQQQQNQQTTSTATTTQQQTTSTDDTTPNVESTYQIGGTVTGLGNKTLTLSLTTFENGIAIDTDIHIQGDNNFLFPNRLSNHKSWFVSNSDALRTTGFSNSGLQNIYCKIDNGKSGTINEADVNLIVTCQEYIDNCFEFYPNDALRNVPIGFKCEMHTSWTSITDFPIFERVEKVGFGEAWKDHNPRYPGSIWSDYLGEFTYAEAVNKCNELGGTLPNAFGFSKLVEKHDFHRIVGKNIIGKTYWAERDGLNNSKKPLFVMFAGSVSNAVSVVSPDINSSSPDLGRSFSVRCIAK